MKKTLLTIMALSFLVVGAAQAAETNSVSKWLNKTTKNIEAKENALYQKASDNKKAAEARRKANEDAAAKAKADAQAKRDANKKAVEAKKQKYENKKKQWKDLFDFSK